MTDTTLPSPLAPPYPADTRAKGWRFELDYEKIEQSDTWCLAAEVPLAQHALLMMWLVAWTQVPCGSFPNDESIIRAKCKVPAKTWGALREILMRGWWPADDGRLYHETITERVRDMLAKRAKDAKRAADNRARRAESPSSHEEVTTVSRVTHNGVGPEFDTKHQAPSTNSSEPSVPRKSRKRDPAPGTVPEETLIEAGFTGEQAADFIAHKAAFKAPLTPRAWADHLRESAKAGWTAADAAEKVMAKGWRGFEAKYVASEPRGQVVPMATHVNRQEALERSNREVGERWLREQEAQ